MREYKIIEQSFSWRKSTEKFESELNDYARKGWNVVSVYFNGSTANAVLERVKNQV